MSLSICLIHINTINTIVYCATRSREGGRLRCSPLVPRRKAAAVTYLVGSVHKVHRDAEGQWVVVGISQQDGHDLHPWGLGFPLASLHSAVHWSLAVDGILAYFTPKQRDGDKSQTHALSMPCPHPFPCCDKAFLLNFLLKQRYISV